MSELVAKEDLARLITVAKRRAAKHRPQGDGRCVECKMIDCEPLQTALRFLELHGGPPEPVIRTRE